MKESGWVIEALCPSGASYWTGRGIGSGYFSPDHLEAVRFARAADAELVRYYLFDPDSKRMTAVREHVWMDA